MKGSFNFKNMIVIFLQGIGALIGFIACLVLVNAVLPVSRAITAAVPESGFLSTPLALLFNGAINGLILVWAGRRSTFKGFILWMQLLALSFGMQVFLTQIETGYFLSAFPLLQGNFEVYSFIFRGFITSALFTLLVTLLVGGFTKKLRSPATFSVTCDGAVKAGAWLPAIYIILYMLFGYFVAWQSQELRLFYGGPKELNPFFEQWGKTLMSHPDFLVFEYFRGVLWILCIIPSFKGFTGNRLEIVILSAIAMGLLPTAQLAFANPLMPATVTTYHFIETSISTGIFGAMCAWFVPKSISQKSYM